MLIEFNIENFLSFKDFTTLSMVASKPFKEHMESHVISLGTSIDLLKSAVIYGNNASGKSNLLEALGFMKAMVLNSFRDALLEENEKRFPLEKFALNTQSLKDSSFFEVSFIQNKVKYRYGFEIDYNLVVAEWLFHSTTKEVYLFKRNRQEIEINKSAFNEALGKEEDIKENVLFLSLLATLGKPLSTQIVEWFKKVNFINGNHDLGHKLYTIERLKSDKTFLGWVLRFLRELEISNISTIEEDFSEINIENLKEKEKDEEILNLLTSINKIQSRQRKRDQIVTFHRIYDENNILVDTIPFNFDTQESEGTKKLLYLLGPWFDTLQNGKILVIDELDSRLHSQLTLRLIDFFHQFNFSNAQLVFAAHDVALLNKETFRRDQIWFVEKNQFGASELYSLGGFKTDTVRNKSAFDKNYLEGKFGAIPYFGHEKELIETLYGKR
ncbi:MAG: ATP-binding protein [Bacteroidia bacterium]|nr:ATP-binding protein [Bacteroidia bacterium]